MSADELRQAAETLRERAQASSRAPWVVDGEDDLEGTAVRAARGAGPTVAQTIPLGYERRRANAAYIATMHPAVGLALADWLDTAGADLWAHGPLCECGSGCHDCDDDLWQPHVRRALALARLINGGVA